MKRIERGNAVDFYFFSAGLSANAVKETFFLKSPHLLHNREEKEHNQINHPPADTAAE